MYFVEYLNNAIINWITYSLILNLTIFMSLKGTFF